MPEERSVDQLIEELEAQGFSFVEDPNAPAAEDLSARNPITAEVMRSLARKGGGFSAWGSWGAS
jgi:hypothetical protein